MSLAKGKHKKKAGLAASNEVAKQMNGHLKEPQGGRRLRAIKKRQSVIGRLFGIAARLAFWYSIITILFRCPSDEAELTDETPRVCRPYFGSRTYVSPHVQPYYENYLAPHVDKIRPYAEHVQQNYYLPVANVVENSYNSYGAPQVSEAKRYSTVHWESSVRPRLEAARLRAKSRYGVWLGPQVNQTISLLRPHYENFKHSVSDIYYSSVLPAYGAAQPYFLQAYGLGVHFTMDIVAPFAQWAYNQGMSFVAQNVWPRLQRVYDENVEPQLMRISERLGRYKEPEKSEATSKHIASTTTTSPSTSTTPNTSVTEKPTRKSKTKTKISKNPSRPASLVKAIETANAQVAEDLRTWQERFATAADKGSDELEERLQEITSRQIETQLRGNGKELVKQLDQTSKDALDEFRSAIKKSAQAVPGEASDANIQRVHEDVNAASRKAGLQIREKAMEVRKWKENFEIETNKLVRAALDSTLTVIDHIRDLGLQEIGMRWAWMDGVTYSHWQKYHQLKDKFREWREEIETAALENEGLQRAWEELAVLEEDAMAIAENAAKELNQLKLGLVA